jgi:adenine-specific DNA methylase
VIPKECKRLAEVDFPIAAVSAHSAREKSIRHGHPSTLHLWWARRPLAACRAVLMALLLPDPCDPNCPADFKQGARRLLKLMPGCALAATDMELRHALLNFIADFSKWENSANAPYLECARGLVRAALGEEPPTVVDPFAGGGSIPLEALRVGCDAFASDLNTVAYLILTVLLEDIPRYAPGLAEELRSVGGQIREIAKTELAEFYPVEQDGSRPIAYLWARTVRCEAVGCGAEIPLIRSFWLCRKTNRRYALRLAPEEPRVHVNDPINVLTNGKVSRRIEIFQPSKEGEVRNGTVSRGNATCPCCHVVLPVSRVRAQLTGRKGGAGVEFDEKGTRLGGARLLAVVTRKHNQSGRHYRIPVQRDYEAVWKANKALEALTAQNVPNGLSQVPDEPLPPQGTLGFRVQLYGMSTWGDIFSPRQKLSLTVLGRLVRTLESSPPHVRRLLALAVSRLADFNSSIARWHAGRETSAASFGRQALPIVWDFCETVAFGDSTGSLSSSLDLVAAISSRLACMPCSAHVLKSDATNLAFSDEAADVLFTDPPYYDAVPYADLSDFFFVWLKRALAGQPEIGNPFDVGNPLTPKQLEIVQDSTKTSREGLQKDRAFFENSMKHAFTEGRRVLRPDGIAAVVFAHKTTEGWEALISALLKGGWTVTASWPITTEMGSRLRARESAALAASIHLICRPRDLNAGTGDWTDVYRELPRRIGDWMERLSAEGIRGADLVFACIGPALELFSRYERVETPDGELVGLGPNAEAHSEPAKRGFLSYVWEVVGRTALEQVLGTAEARARNGGAGALEEDARLTALFLWTLQSTSPLDGSKPTAKEQLEEEEIEAEEIDEDAENGEGGGQKKSKKKGLTLIFDVVRRFAQPLGIHLPEWERRIIETEKGVVRLLSVSERARQLFGEEGASAMAAVIERSGAAKAQFILFPESEAGITVPIRRRGGRRSPSGAESLGEARHKKEATTLDRVHAAMLLQASGASGALRAMLEEEQKRGLDFLRLSNALSALYPKTSEEKRLLDAMLLAVPRR